LCLGLGNRFAAFPIAFSELRLAVSCPVFLPSPCFGAWTSFFSPPYSHRFPPPYATRDQAASQLSRMECRHVLAPTLWDGFCFFSSFSPFPLVQLVVRSFYLFQRGCSLFYSEGCPDSRATSSLLLTSYCTEILFFLDFSWMTS